jgi:flagellin
MPLTINTNIASLFTQRNLSHTSSGLSEALQRLSSGHRINSAKDDAAGIAIASLFTAQIKGYNQGARNASDGISLAQTAEGSLNEISSNLQRIRELAVQSANATNSLTDRQALQTEVDQLTQEISRVVDSSTFNGIGLLNSTGNLSFQVGASADNSSRINISSTSLIPVTTGTPEAIASLKVVDIIKSPGTLTDVYTRVADLLASEAPAHITGWSASDGDRFRFSYFTSPLFNSLEGLDAGTGVSYTSRGDDIDGGNHPVWAADSIISAMWDTARVAIFEQQNDHPFGNPTISSAAITAAENQLATYGVASSSGGISSYNGSSSATGTIDISSASAARTAISSIDDDLKEVNKQRAGYGATQNRFESVIRNAENVAENLSAARSRIEDADFAQETASLVRLQILESVGISILSQANSLPQSVLSLL